MSKAVLFVEVMCILGFVMMAVFVERAAGCGADFKGNNLTGGSFSTPSWPSPYPRDVTCTWQISSPLRTYIMLDVKNLNLFDDASISGCDDFIRIEINKQSPYSYCNKMSYRFYTPDNNMKIIFRAGPKNVFNTGFDANFRVLPSTCPSSKYTAMSGTLYSPNYPNNYPADVQCYYVITLPQGYRVSITFPTMSLVRNDCSDHVMIYDGKNSSYPTIAKVCGPITLHALVSSGHVMTVMFYSDDAYTSKGFVGMYSAVKISPSPSVTSRTAPTASRTEILTLLPTYTVPTNSTVDNTVVSSTKTLMVTPTTTVPTPSPTHPPLPLDLDGKFQILRDVTLKGHVISSTVTPSTLVCLFKCQQTFGCKAVTFEPIQVHGYCTLHNASLQSHHGNVQRLDGALYYQSVA